MNKLQLPVYLNGHLKTVILKKIIITISLAFGVMLTFIACDDSNSYRDETQILEGFRTALLDEINFVRTDPALYAEQRLLPHYNQGADNGAYLDISSRSPVQSLELSEPLNSAAQKYAYFLADHDHFGHFENGSPYERCLAEEYYYFSGENLAAGTYNSLNAFENLETAAVRFLLQWIIDAGVSDLGHRRNVMNAMHKKMGVGFSNNIFSLYINYAVQEFGYK